MSSFNHYRTLEVDKKATTSQIRKAYRRLAMDHHPDKGGDTRQFQKIQDAYDVLSDPGKRAQYDGVGDGQTLASQPQIQHQKFPLTLEDMYKGGSKEIKLEYLVSCLGCGGQGGEGTVCSTCKGTKMMQKGIQLGPGMYQMVRQQCTTCHGKGREITSPCTTCHGKGQISKVSTQSVSFPRGVLPNEQIDIDVTGETIMLHVSTKPNPDFSRKNFDLHLKTRIHWVQALTGKDIFIDHIKTILQPLIN